jgi:Lar family restriction alleviation protein
MNITKEQREALKPCPFCGESPRLVADVQMDNGADTRTIYRVECGNSGCGVRPRVATFGPWGYKQPEDMTAEEAQVAVVEKWNRRPAPLVDDDAVHIGFTTHWDLDQAKNGGVGRFFGNRDEFEHNIGVFTGAASTAKGKDLG